MHRFFLTKTKSALLIIFISVYTFCFSLSSAPLFRIQILSKTIDIKQQASLSSETVATAVKGTVFEVSQELPEWYIIETPDGKGYLSKNYGNIEKIQEQKKREPGKAQKKVQEKQYVLIVKPGSFIRQTPAHSATAIATAKINNAFLLSAIKGEWFEVTLANGEKGYVLQNVAKIINQQAWQGFKSQKKTPAPQQTTSLPQSATDNTLPANAYARIIKNNVKLRQQPDSHSPAIGTAKKGEIFKIVGKENNWYEVFFSIDNNAYLYAPLIKVIGEADVVAAAKPAPAPAKENTVAEKQEDILISIEGSGKKSSSGRAKYVIITPPEVYLKAKASSSAPTAMKAKKGEEFKLIWKMARWYEVEIGPGKTAFLPSSQGEIEIREEIDYSDVANESNEPTEETEPNGYSWQSDIIPENTYFLVNRTASLHDAPAENGTPIGQAFKGNIFKIFSSHEEWYAVEISGGVAFIAKNSGRTINQYEAKRIQEQVKRENELMQARQKAKEEAAQAAAKKEAEQQEQFKDTYILITAKKVNLRKAPTQNAPPVGTAFLNDCFKLINQTQNWYHVHTSSGNAFIAANLSKIITQQERNNLNAKQQKLLQEKAEKEREELARKEAAVKAKQEALHKAHGVTAQKVEAQVKSKAKAEAMETSMLEAEKQAKKTTQGSLQESITKRKAETAIKEQEWIKDKYILIARQNVRLRASPSNKAALIGKAPLDADFKLISRKNEWYEIRFSSGMASSAQPAYIHASLVKVITEDERQSYRQMQERKRLAKEKEVVEKKAREEAEQRKIKEDNEKKRANETEWLKDKYILVTAKQINIRKEPTTNAQILKKAKKGETFKLLSRTKEWYEIFWTMEHNAYIAAQIGTIIPEAGLKTPLESGQKTDKEKEQIEANDQARKETEQKTRQEAEERARQKKTITEAEAKAKQEAEEKERQAALETQRKIKEEAERKAKERAALKARQEAEVKAKEEEWLKDKYLLVTLNNTNLRSRPTTASNVAAKATAGETFKLLSRSQKDWYEVAVSSGSVFVYKKIGKVLTEQECNELKAAQVKVKEEAERKARLAAEEKAKLAAEEKTRREAARKAQLEASYQAQQKKVALAVETKANHEAEMKTKQEAERKAKAEAEQKRRQDQEEKERREAEEKAKEQEWLKDKYVIITAKNGNIRTERTKNAPVLTTAHKGETFKLISRTKEWYEIFWTMEHNAYVATQIGTIITEAELKIKLENEQKTREEKEQVEAEGRARKEAERKARQEAEERARQEKIKAAAEARTKREAEEKEKQAALQAEIEATRKAREEAELKAKEAAALKAQQEAELKAKEDEWLKDKYILVTLNHTNLRQKPNANAKIIAKANTDETFKLLSRSQKEWFEVAVSSGSAFINKQISKILSEQELNDFKAAQVKAKQEAELKAKLAAEEKARIAAEEKAKKEAARKAQLEAAYQAQRKKVAYTVETKAKQEAEQKVKQETERKAKAEAEEKRRQAEEEKERLATEEKAKEQEWLKNKYIFITVENGNARKEQKKNGPILGKVHKGQTFKLISRTKEWYEIFLTIDENAFIATQLGTIITEAELKTKIENERKARQEKELFEAVERERKEAKQKTQREAEERARLEKAKAEAELKAKEEEWLKDKYIYIVVQNANLREKPSPSAKIISKTKKEDSFKLLSRSFKKWYEVAVSSATAFIDKDIVKIINEQELNDLRAVQAKAKEEAAKRAAEEKARKEAERLSKLQAEQRAREEAEAKAQLEAQDKAKREAEEKAREDAEQQAKLEAARIAREEAEQKAKEAAALKAKYETELKTKENEWLKDKYVYITTQNTHVREKPSPSGRVISKAKKDDSFKLISRSYRNWFEVAVSSGTAFIDKDIVIIVNEQELNDLRIAQARAKEEAELKTRLAAEEAIRIAAEEKARKEAEALAKLQAEQKAREEAEVKAKLAAQEKAKQEAEEKARREAEQRAKLETEQKTREAAEQRAKELVELKAKQEAEKRANIENFVADKYLLITATGTTMRSTPSLKSPIAAKAKYDADFKVLWVEKDNQGTDWYKISSSSGAVAFISSAVVKLVTAEQLTSYRVEQQKAREEKERVEAEEQARKEAERKARQEAEERARQEKAKAAAVAKAKREAEEKEKQAALQAEIEATRKAREEAEQKAKEAAALKTQQEAELKAKEEEWLKDKYIVVTLPKANLRQNPSTASKVLGQAKASDAFKLMSRSQKDWYEIAVSSGSAFLNKTLGKILTAQELDDRKAAEAKAKEEAALKARLAAEEKARIAAEEKLRKEAEALAKLQTEQKAREEKLIRTKKEAEEKAIREAEETAKTEAELKTRLAAEQKAREEAEHKTKELAELKAKQEAEAAQKAKEEALAKTRREAELKTRVEEEARAKMAEFVKDKYILLQGESVYIRKKPSGSASVIGKALKGDSFKLLAITGEWYEISLSSGTAFLPGYVASSLANVITETELRALQEAERKAKEEAELKSKEEEARIARVKAEEKAKKEAELLAKLEQEQRILKEKRLQEEEVRQKKAAELQAKLEAEQKAKEEAEHKAKELAELHERKKAETKLKIEAELKAKEEAERKAKELTVLRTTLEAEEKAQQEAEEKLKKETARKAQQEVELKAAEEAAKKARVEAEEKAKKEVELLANREAEKKAVAESAKREAERQEAERKVREEKIRREEEARTKMEAFVKDKYVCIVADSANVRQQPDKKSLLLGKVGRGEYYKLNWVANDWYEIKIPSGTISTTGFVFGPLVKILNETEYTALLQKDEAIRTTTAAELKGKEEKKANINKKGAIPTEVEDNKEYYYVAIKTSYAEVRSVPDINSSALFIALKDDIFKYNGQQKGWYHITTFSGETRYIQKTLCRGLSVAPALPQNQTLRREIYDDIIDAKDRAMVEATMKYPTVTTQQQLQEKIFYQQNMEEKFVLDIFHKYKIQPALYLAILREAIDNNW